MLNYKNFLLFPEDVAKESHYNFSDITYDINLQDKVINNMGAIILYYSSIYDNLVELQTKGDGSCFFYATETINSLRHQKIKLNLLKVNIRNCLQQAVTQDHHLIILDLIQFAKEGNSSSDYNSVIMKYVIDIDWSIKEIKQLPETVINAKHKLGLIEALNAYKYNQIGFGLDLIDAVNILKDIEKLIIFHVYPMTKWQLDKIAKETQLPIDEVKTFDLGSLSL